MREDEVPVQIDGFLVILSRLGELVLDEVKLRSVIVYVRVRVILVQGLFEVCRGFLWLAWAGSQCFSVARMVLFPKSKKNIPSSR